METINLGGEKIGKFETNENYKRQGQFQSVFQRWIILNIQPTGYPPPLPPPSKRLYILLYKPFFFRNIQFLFVKEED